MQAVSEIIFAQEHGKTSCHKPCKTCWTCKEYNGSD